MNLGKCSTAEKKKSMIDNFLDQSSMQLKIRGTWIEIKHFIHSQIFVECLLYVRESSRPGISGPLAWEVFL